MTFEQLEQKVNELERQLIELRESLRLSHGINGVEATFGLFGDDQEFDEMVQLGREYRRQVNREVE
jgi:hypothetical protein